MHGSKKHPGCLLLVVWFPTEELDVALFRAELAHAMLMVFGRAARCPEATGNLVALPVLFLLAVIAACSDRVSWCLNMLRLHDIHITYVKMRREMISAKYISKLTSLSFNPIHNNRNDSRVYVSGFNWGNI